MHSNSDLTWLVCAHRKELDGLEGLLQKYPRLRFFEIGVGMMEAAFRFPALLEKIRAEKSRGVLLAGSAGSIGVDEKGDVALCHDFAMPLLRDEEIPEFLESSWSSESFSGVDTGLKNSQATDLPGRRVYGSFGVSLDPERYRQEAKGGWENMEAAMVSYLCLKNSIPFEALLYCTNRVSFDGRNEWNQNYRQAGVVLREKIDLFSGDLYG